MPEWMRDTVGNHLRPACKAMEVTRFFLISVTRPVPAFWAFLWVLEASEEGCVPSWPLALCPYPSLYLLSLSFICSLFLLRFWTVCTH